MTEFNWSDDSAMYELRRGDQRGERSNSANEYILMRLEGFNQTEAAEHELVRQHLDELQLTRQEEETKPTAAGPAGRVHKAVPGIVRGDHCAVCGQNIRRVPDATAPKPIYVHADSGAVAAPNPPRALGPDVSDWDSPEDSVYDEIRPEP